MTSGTRVKITGGCTFAGLVLGANDICLAVSDGSQTLYLRRDIASMEPLAWRYRGMPVRIQAEPERHPGFGARLAELERRTRP